MVQCHRRKFDLNPMATAMLWWNYRDTIAVAPFWHRSGIANATWPRINGRNEKTSVHDRFWVECSYFVILIVQWGKTDFLLLIKFTNKTGLNFDVSIVLRYERFSVHCFYVYILTTIWNNVADKYYFGREGESGRSDFCNSTLEAERK